MNIDPYLVGVLYGDGWTYKRSDGSYVNCIDQAEKNKRIILEEVIPRFRKMGFKTNPYRFFAKHDGIFKWRALVYSKALHLQLKETFPRIVRYFKNLSIHDSKLFIAGFMDAEGTVMGKKLAIYNKNIKLLKAIQRKLQKIGIEPTPIYKYNVVHGLTLIRKAVIGKFVTEIPARKFKMRSYSRVIRWAQSD